MQCLLLQKKLDLRLLQTIFSRWNLLQSYQKMSLKKLPVAVGLSISVRRKWTHAKWAARITQSSESPPRNLIQNCHIIFIRFNSKFGFRSKLCYRIGKDFSLHSNDPVRLSWIPRTVKPTASWMYQLFWLLLNSKVTVYSQSGNLSFSLETIKRITNLRTIKLWYILKILATVKESGLMMLRITWRDQSKILGREPQDEIDDVTFRARHPRSRR